LFDSDQSEGEFAVGTATETKQWACPDSRTILRADATREQWLAERLKGVGGSEIAVLFGLTKRQTRHGLWLIKTGQVRDDKTNAFMERGADVEPIVVRKFAAKTGLAVRKAGLQRSRHNPRLQYSPDALVEDGALFEAKLVSQYARERWLNEYGDKVVPADYEWQVRHGLAVTGRRFGYLAALDADSWELDIFEIEAQDGDYELLDGTVGEFWRHVTDGTAPPIDYASATPEEMLYRFPNVIAPDSMAEALIPEQAIADRDRLAEIRALHAKSRAVEKEEAEIKTRLTMQIGDKEFLAVPNSNGQLKPILRWKQVNSTKFREREFKAAHPALAEEFTDKGTSRRLEIVKDGAE
jgi:putative phage-type endonuclease